MRATAPISVMVLGGLVSALGRWEIVGLGILPTQLSRFMIAGQLLLAKITVTEVHPYILVFYRTAIGALLIAGLTLPTGHADFNVAASYRLVTLVGITRGSGVTTIQQE